MEDRAGRRSRGTVASITVSRQHGFSLLEVLVVAVIVGVLTSLSAVTYRGYVHEACRTDAKISLQHIANLQEQYYFTHHRYADAIEQLLTHARSLEGHYHLALAPIDDDAHSYRATATQRDDDRCLPDPATQYRIDHTNQREHSPDGASWQMGWE